MSVTIEQRVEDLLRHSEVWDETKETLRDLLSEFKAGTLDPDDARYIEGLHAKMFGERGGAPSGARSPGPRGGPAWGTRPVRADIMRLVRRGRCGPRPEGRRAWRAQARPPEGPGRPATSSLERR